MRSTQVAAGFPRLLFNGTCIGGLVGSAHSKPSHCIWSAVHQALGSFAHLPGQDCAFHCPSHKTQPSCFAKAFSWSVHLPFLGVIYFFFLPWQKESQSSPCSSRSCTGSLPFPLLCLLAENTRELLKNHSVDKMYYADSD